MGSRREIPEYEPARRRLLQEKRSFEAPGSHAQFKSEDYHSHLCWSGTFVSSFAIDAALMDYTVFIDSYALVCLYGTDHLSSQFCTDAISRIAESQCASFRMN